MKNRLSLFSFGCVQTHLPPKNSDYPDQRMELLKEQQVKEFKQAFAMFDKGMIYEV